MHFPNPFSQSPQDTYEQYSLIAEHNGQLSQSTESVDETSDNKNHNYISFVLLRSAKDSVLSFLDKHQNSTGTLTWKNRFLSALELSALLLPAFVVSPFIYFTRPPSNEPQRKRLSHTAYLDGLRGVAAFVVYIFHFSYLWFPDLAWGYGFEGHRMFLQMPIIRALHSGRASVTVFFVISGFVLTLKTLTMIHNGKGDQALTVLAGSAFRRPLRLYLPIFAATFIIALLVYGGNFVRDPSGASIPPRGETLNDQLQHWFWSTVNLMNPFRPIINRENMKGSEYDGHLWTIPVEFKGSLLVFFLLLIFARTKRWIHMVSVLGIAFWLVHTGDWDQALFCAGLLLAEMSIILPNGSQSSETPEDETLGYSKTIITNFGLRIGHVFRHGGTLVLFFLGMHLFSYPQNDGSSTPGFITISQWVPAYYQASGERIQLFWISIGAIVFIFALMYSPTVSFSLHFPLPRLCNFRLPWYQTTASLNDGDKEEFAAATFWDREAARREPLLQRPFTTSFAQYLGRISYSLYLWHGAINHMIGVRWLSPAYTTLQLARGQAKELMESGNDAAAIDLTQSALGAYRLAFFYGFLVNTLALLWASDVFNALVDVNAVKLTRWLEQKCWRRD
ncbi:hypothetical protein GCG54_00008223 [Colletotrichum gloeosporioides]|uniref:Acyltransferase 3 domain-containing protein n=1 Tax=Colletotrichum gloeosporioides TaxID=474922 RepID=A0A8H4FDX3_COLGL|nr:uncharacterized protein GCG54_00008223 [Colletotrichum gloeosporioides]KAF3798768.1 hypothetical protein GCG54_00008223 [Colletotrichum gloeosporioides]